MEEYIVKFKSVLNGFFRGFVNGVTPTKGPMIQKALQNSKYFLEPVSDVIEATLSNEYL
jgi:hypothetical protein